MKGIIASLDSNIIELTSLATSLDIEVVDKFIQKRSKPDPKYYLGKGKIEEIKDFIMNNKINIAIFNTALKPSQWFSLEDYLKITVYDRIRLILEIFKDRAYSQEAKLQVELAKLQYEMPLMKDWIHKGKIGEHPGFLAGGEYDVAQHLETSKKRVKKIKQKLIKIESQREIIRKQRKKHGYYLISIVGYANAGKSSLFQLLSGEKVIINDRMFSTLAIKTRKLPGIKKPILITDTIGFIEDLPPWMIRAFHSTLEEVFLSDVVLLVVDISDPQDQILRKIKTSTDILLPEVKPQNIILALNKIDMIKEEKTEKNNYLTTMIQSDIEIPETLQISANDIKYRDKILSHLLHRFEYPNHIKIMILKNKGPKVQNFINWIRKNTEITNFQGSEEIIIDFNCKEEHLLHILNECEKYECKILYRE